MDDCLTTGLSAFVAIYGSCTKSDLRMQLAFERSVEIGPYRCSRLGIGTWSWGNRLLFGYDESQDDSLRDTFDYCVARGVNFFDTGDSYGTGPRFQGRAETLLGRFSENNGSSDDVVLATKLASFPWRITPGSFERASQDSARRLRCSSVPLVQIHWSTANYAPWQDKVIWEGFARMYEKGYAKAIGVSNFGPRQLRDIHHFMRERGVPLSSCQFQMSLLKRSAIESGLLETCGELGIQPIGYSPLCLGVLTGKYSVNQLPTGARGILFRELLKGSQVLLRTLRAISAERGKSVAQVAINWSLSQDVLTLVGARSVVQAVDSLGATGWRLTGQELEDLDRAARACTQQMIENPFQTK